MKRHVVKDGECTTSVSDLHGFFWETIWDHADNAELKRRRKDPNRLVPGDTLAIPDLRVKEEDRAAEKRHRYRKKGIPAICRLQVFDGEEPRANQAYVFDVDGVTHEGETDADGVLEVPIPPNARRAKLIIGPDNYEEEFRFGHIQPAEELAGVQARLRNLGYDCGAIDGELGDRTRAALTLFQERFELDVSGEADQATRDKLVELHDSLEKFPESDEGESDDEKDDGRDADG